MFLAIDWTYRFNVCRYPCLSVAVYRHLSLETLLLLSLTGPPLPCPHRGRHLAIRLQRQLRHGADRARIHLQLEPAREHRQDQHRLDHREPRPQADPRAAAEREPGVLRDLVARVRVPALRAALELPGTDISVDSRPRIHLRARFRGAGLRFSVSPDGTGRLDIGPDLDASRLSDDYGDRLRFTGAFVGVCAQDLAGTGAVADFDRFEIQDL